MLSLYALKLSLGKHGILYQRGQYSTDYTTGQNTSVVQTLNLDYIIKTEQNTSFQQLMRSLVNTPIKPDAIYQDTETFLIDSIDLPNGWLIGPRDWLTFGDDRFEIINVKLTEKMNFIVINAKKMQGKVEKILTISIVDYIKFAGVAGV